MANDNLYGVVLSPVQDNARVMDAPASGGGGLATALSSLAKGVSSVTDQWDRSAQRKRQEASDARASQEMAWKIDDRNREETERLIGSDVALAVANVDAGAESGPPSPMAQLPEEFNILLGSSVRKIKNMDSAVAQGKLPAISREAQVQQTFQALVTKYGPQYAGQIAKSMRDMGVGNALTDEITAEMDAEQSTRKAENDFNIKMLEAAKTNLDPRISSGMSDAELIDWGINYTRNDNELTMRQRQATLQSTQNATNQNEYNFNKQVNADQYSVAINDQAMTAIQPIAQQMQKVLIAMGEPGADPSLEARYSELLTLARTSANNIVNSLVARGGYANAEQADQARGRLMTYIQQTIFDPYEQRNKGFAQAVDIFNKRLGFSQKISAPVINDLRTKFGINPTDIPEIMNSLPPAVLDGLRSELAGVGRPGVNENISTIHLTNIVSVLKGEKNLNHIDTPQERQAVVAQSWNYVRNGAGAVAAGNGNPDAWMNSTRQLVIASAGFSANTPTNNIAAASLAMFDAPTMNAIQKLRSNSSTAEEAQVLSQGIRASAAVTLSAVKQQIKAQRIDPKSSPWRVGVNSEGKAVIYPNSNWKAPTTIGGIGGMGASFGPRNGNTSRPPIPDNLQKMVDVHNATTGFLARTAAWDDDSPKGTQREIRLFWATGNPTEDMRKKQQQQRSQPSVRGMMDRLEKDLINAPNLLEAPSGDVVDSIIGHETGGSENPSTARNPRSSATGAGQFIDSTWISMIKKNRPDLAQGKSKDEILALRRDPNLSRQMVGFYARDNAQVLKNAGLPANNTNLSMMHLLGPGEGPKVLSANPNTPMEQLVSNATLQANPWMRGKTVADIKRKRNA